MLHTNIFLFPGFPVRWLCIINNNKPAQSEAIIESLLSADINGIPSSELLCGYLIGRHMGGSQPAPVVMLGTPTDVRPAPWRGSGCHFWPGRLLQKGQGRPRTKQFSLEARKQRQPWQKREMTPQTNTVALISDSTCSEHDVYWLCVCWRVVHKEERRTLENTIICTKYKRTTTRCLKKQFQHRFL